MALAVTFPITSVKDTSNIEVYTTASFTPTANALMIVFSYVVASVLEISLSGGGYEWNVLHKVVPGMGGDTMGLWWTIASASPSAMTISADVTGDAGTGGIIQLSQWTGFNTTTPIQQAALVKSNISANPTITFDSFINTGNGAIIMFANNTSPFAATQPAGWIEDEDSGFSSPATGLYVAHILSGETGRAIATTAISSSNKGFGVEIIEASQPPLVRNLSGLGVG